MGAEGPHPHLHTFQPTKLPPGPSFPQPWDPSNQASTGNSSCSQGEARLGKSPSLPSLQKTSLYAPRHTGPTLAPHSGSPSLSYRALRSNRPTHPQKPHPGLSVQKRDRKLSTLSRSSLFAHRGSNMSAVSPLPLPPIPLTATIFPGLGSATTLTPQHSSLLPRLPLNQPRQTFNTGKYTPREWVLSGKAEASAPLPGRPMELQGTLA